jgi:hypothetical protein
VNGERPSLLRRRRNAYSRSLEISYFNTQRANIIAV